MKAVVPKWLHVCTHSQHLVPEEICFGETKIVTFFFGRNLLISQQIIPIFFLFLFWFFFLGGGGRIATMFSRLQGLLKRAKFLGIRIWLLKDHGTKGKAIFQKLSNFQIFSKVKEVNWDIR